MCSYNSLRSRLEVQPNGSEFCCRTSLYTSLKRLAIANELCRGQQQSLVRLPGFTN